MPVRRSANVLVFVDVAGATPGGGGNRFQQYYNAQYPAFAANPPNEAISYRHGGTRANVAFLDGHVDTFAAKTPDNNLPTTHQNEGIHAEFLAGRITHIARTP